MRRKKITMEMVWNKTKKNFVFGKDYIETETEDYSVFCPFNYSILSIILSKIEDKISELYLSMIL